MLVLGIDPGFANLGWAIAELNGRKVRPVKAGVVFTRPEKGPAEPVRLRRAAEIDSCIRQISLAYQQPPGMVVAEGQSWPRSAKATIGLAMSWGILVALTQWLGVPLVTYTPQQIKKVVTGSARASKVQVVEALEATYSIEDWGVKGARREHCADALGAIHTHAALGVGL